MYVGSEIVSFKKADTAAILPIEELDKSEDYINAWILLQYRAGPKSLGCFFPSFFHDDIPVLSPS
jgi:hypothetical protein